MSQEGCAAGAPTLRVWIRAFRSDQTVEDISEHFMNDLDHSYICCTTDIGANGAAHQPPVRDAVNHPGMGMICMA